MSKLNIFEHLISLSFALAILIVIITHSIPLIESPNTKILFMVSVFISFWGMIDWSMGQIKK